MQNCCSCVGMPNCVATGSVAISICISSTGVAVLTAVMLRLGLLMPVVLLLIFFANELVISDTHAHLPPPPHTHHISHTPHISLSVSLSHTHTHPLSLSVTHTHTHTHTHTPHKDSEVDILDPICFPFVYSYTPLLCPVSYTHLTLPTRRTV